jgi:hypothetical protein
MEKALVVGLDLPVAPAPDLPHIGICECCGKEVIAKLGSFMPWHWAHKGNPDCDPWHEESPWHNGLKSYFDAQFREVVPDRTDANGKKHRADILTPDGLFIEVQHSWIGVDEILEREAFYQNLIWIVDACKGKLNAATFGRHVWMPKDVTVSCEAEFLCSGPCKALRRWNIAKRVFFDFGDEFLWEYGRRPDSEFKDFPIEDGISLKLAQCPTVTPIRRNYMMATLAAGMSLTDVLKTGRLIENLGSVDQINWKGQEVVHYQEREYLATHFSEN